MANPSRISDVLAKLGETMATLPPGHDAEVNRREAAVRAMAVREVEISPAIALRRELENRLSTATQETRRAIACGIIATALARQYRVTPSAANTSTLERLTAEYGSKLLFEVVCEILDEGRDPKVRNIFKVLVGRLRARQEAAR